MTPSLNVRLYGTDEPPPELTVLRAGALSAELDGGNLRHIRHGGVEIIRAISFLVRDRDWGTLIPVISDLVVEEDGDRFAARYTAVVTAAGNVLRYRADIVGTPRELRFCAEAVAEHDFATNRTGFVVLHPLNGVAGAPATIERVDGSIVAGRFPDRIDPVQPMMALRALTHAPVPGLSVACRMEGDTFEMEDQRNWTDASYKTYVRPLALPWPYVLPAGERLVQAVTLTLTGEALEVGNADAPAMSSPAIGSDRASGPTGEATAAAAAVPASAAVRLKLGAKNLKLGAKNLPLPPVGVGLQPAEIAGTLARLDLFAALAPRQVVYHCDPRAGGIDGLADAAAIARRLGAEAWLEAVIAGVDDFAAEVALLGEATAALGQPFRVVLVSPAADLKSTLPGSPWPAAPDAAALYRAARAAFPGARIGGGVFAYFTELNRKRPPLDHLDLVGFTTSAVVHAGDDVSVMESLEAMPYVIASARAIAGDRPVAVGPSAIAMRLNPYGAAPVDNPRDIRQAMNGSDPRQRGLFAAAWTVGYAAAAVAGGAAALTFGGTVGPHGVAGDAPYPVFHAVRALAALAGRPASALESSDPAAVAGIAAEADGRTVALLANLTAAAQAVELPFAPAALAVLDADTFAAAAADPAALDAGRAGAGRTLTLAPFALARVVSG